MSFFLNALKPTIVRPRLEKQTLHTDDVNSLCPNSNLSFVSKIVKRVVISTETAVVAVHDSNIRAIDSVDVCAQMCCLVPALTWLNSCPSDRTLAFHLNDT